MADLVGEMGREPVLPFSCFWAGPPEAEEHELLATLEQRVAPVDEELTWWHAFWPSQQERHKLYEKITGAEHHTAGDGTVKYAYDLDQKPTRRPRISCTVGEGKELGLLMTLVSHGVITMDGKPLLTVDWMGVHGYVFPPYGENPFSKAILDLLYHNAIKYSSVKSMVGNGWHLPSMGLLYMKLLSAIEMRKKEKVQHALMSADDDQDDEDQFIVDNACWDAASPCRDRVVLVDASPSSEEKLKAMMITISETWEFGEPHLEGSKSVRHGVSKDLTATSESACKKLRQ